MGNNSITDYQLRMKQAKKLETIIRSAFSNAWDVRNNEKFSRDNHSKHNFFRSAKFVSEVADGIWEEFYSKPEERNHHKLNVQSVDNKGEKEKGEWLYDICITRTITVSRENPQTITLPTMNTGIPWAVESEAATGLQDFCTDFGKLLCSGAKNCLYMHGLDQGNSKTRDTFINRRLGTIQTHLGKHLGDVGNLYLCFWPSPKKVNGMSIWDNPSAKDLPGWIKMYVYHEGEFHNQ